MHCNTHRMNLGFVTQRTVLAEMNTSSRADLGNDDCPSEKEQDRICYSEYGNKD